MNLGEICGLIQDEEIVPLFVVAQVEQTVIGQDLLMLECSGKQELLEFEHIVLDFPEVGFDALHFFSLEVFENPFDDQGSNSTGGSSGIKSFVSTVFVHQALGGNLFRKFLHDNVVLNFGKIDGYCHGIQSCFEDELKISDLFAFGMASSMVLLARWILLGICVKSILILA